MAVINRLRILAIWGIVLAMVIIPLWSLLTPHRPVDNLQTLDGCYEGEGLPDFMRPHFHWSMRISNGTVFGREGIAVAKVRLGAKGDNETPVAFSPGILVAGKPATVSSGDTVAGNAYIKGGRVTVVLKDELRQVLLRTTCS